MPAMIASTRLQFVRCVVSLTKSIDGPEQEASSTRERVIVAALALFSDKGFSQTTTREIAICASVNEVTLFRHFESKEGLLKAVLESTTPKLLLESDLAAQWTGDIQCDLKAVAKTLLAECRRQNSFYRFLIYESGQRPEIQKMLRESLLFRRKRLGALLAHAAGPIKSRQVSPELLVSILIAPVVMRNLEQILLGEALSANDDLFLEQYTNLMLHGLTHFLND